MKTLDEVIEAQERCGTYPNCHFCYLHSGPMCEWIRDALHYLKEYRGRLHNLQDMMDRYEINDRNYQEAVQNCEMVQLKYQQLLNDYNDNPALTWDNLCLMVGKPVWIEYDNHLEGRKRTKFKDWEVINCILDDMCIVKGDFDYHKSELGKTWQAYRKERK